MSTPPGIGKAPGRIKFDRLSRFFVTDNAAGQTEAWREMGHFAQGVDNKIKRVSQKDGRANFTGEKLGWLVSGTYEPSQNEPKDYDFYEQYMNGKLGVAMLTGDQLWLFRIRPLGANKFEDNRISLLTYPAYGKTYRNGAGEFSGFIRNYEFYTVKDFSVTTRGQMFFTIVAKHIPNDGVPGVPAVSVNNGGGQ